MRCPRCGTVMNKHAEKLVKEDRSQEASRSAADSEVVAAIHYCPGCGKVEEELFEM